MQQKMYSSRHYYALNVPEAHSLIAQFFFFEGKDLDALKEQRRGVPLASASTRGVVHSIAPVNAAECVLCTGYCSTHFKWINLLEAS